ncbi:conserved hypothetical protein [Vibrio nigripulchritudo MADA3029]|uniref:Shedu immune nuclease family protein n=1 Tax=Vibrio nigripulchritudo TaxID=28173 RepID=UPI0003B1D52B|nr:Shedu immune nuclease family protein [Vibrio nigripulchritudo]CCN47482.1 conserved hypothetical protein [Vibrio nigripulchritudo MADA3020]CCN55888.1 conserved hypothetical protein [Vibrio nigripulchritudo MADA3021]CCN57112.1 conserved hypothetical protein [Vibrio nigripulchritudo MADA3029]
MKLVAKRVDNLEPLSYKSDGVSMLSELRRELLLDISDGEKRIGTLDEIKSWIFEQYQSNPLVGDMFNAILMIKKDLIYSESDLPQLSECMSKITKLETLPLPEFCFITSSIQGDVKGVLIQREELIRSGLVYSITIFDRDNLTKRVARLEIRACKEEPEPFISILTLNGWAHISREDVKSNEYAVFSLRCLIATHGYEYPVLTKGSITVDEQSRPATNKYLLELILQAHRNKIKCYKAEVPLSIIKLRDINYALSIPDEIIQYYISEVYEFGFPFSELLIYQDGNIFISDDDYPVYLAYTAMDISIVPVVILGDFNSSGVKVLSEGGGELLPPIGVQEINDSRTLMKTKEQVLREKVSSLCPKISNSTILENRFVHFCRLIGSSSTKEKDLHEFLNKNPQILDGHMASMFSEVRIGRYRADIVIRYEQVDKKVVLIELERHSDKIFTKSNRIRKKVTHASQQVEDWINEIRLGANNVPEWLTNQYNPEGFVVIGRSKDLSEDQKQILFSLNVNRKVKILTYDDLLERMKRLMTVIGNLN